MKSSFSLAGLVSPKTVSEFKEHIWPKTPMVLPPSLERVAALSLPEFESIETFAKTYVEKVTILHPNGFATDVPTGAVAAPFLRQGYTLYFRNIQRVVPAFAEVTERIASELGIPRGLFTCEIFTSLAAEAGVAMHSDYDVNFSVLLRGEKEWTFAPNEHILHQTNICVSGGRPQPDQRQLDYVVKHPLPETMPASAETIRALPGSVVFMPRGTWHRTRSFGDCASMNFVMKGPTWATVATQALQKVFTEQPAWREYAYGISGQGEEKERAVKELGTRLREFRVQISEEHDLASFAEQLIQRYLEEK